MYKKKLLNTWPAARINDCFVADGSNLNFTPAQNPYKDPIIMGEPNRDFRFQASFYEKIGVDIVIETVMDYPYPFVTEKTYRPIASGRPFIIMGPFGTLKFLKSFGFMTFSSIIDETYDDVINAEERFRAVCESVMKFVNRSIDDVKTDIDQIKSELNHNLECLMTLKHRELFSIREQIKID